MSTGVAQAHHQLVPSCFGYTVGSYVKVAQNYGLCGHLRYRHLHLVFSGPDRLGELKKQKAGPWKVCCRMKAPLGKGRAEHDSMGNQRLLVGYTCLMQNRHHEPACPGSAHV